MGAGDRNGASRRDFLRAVGGAVGAAALPLSAGRAAASPSPNEYDVVVVGAGFAGVTAARELGHAGLRVLVLEARNRLGGRTFTAHSGGHLYELGGTWIHSTQPHVFAEVSRYGLEIVDTAGPMPDVVQWWDGERAREGGIGEALPLVREAICSTDETGSDVPLSVLESFALLSSQMREFHAGAAASFPRPYDPSFSDAWLDADRLSVRDRLNEMDLSPSRAGLVEGVLGALAHGDLSEAGLADMLRCWALSYGDLVTYSDSLARYRLRDGTIGLIEAMLADGRPDVRLGTPVAEVAQTGERVEVTTTRGERFTARAAIAALPMNVLANIRFTPELAAEKLAASRERHAGAGLKAYIRVRGRLPQVSLFADESQPFSSIATMQGEGEDSELVAFGTDPGQIDVHDRGAVQAALRRFLPDVQVTQTLAYDWHLDPYSLGTWCVLRKGQMTKYMAALRAPHGRVRFAGGDFALGWRGFIDGAIESGNRVAHEVIAELGGRAAQPVAASHAAPALGGSRAAPAAAPEAFGACAVCHPTDASGAPGAGPNLRGVADRPVANDPSFPYSEALRSRSGRWSDEELSAFLADPGRYAPGTTMPFGGLEDPAERAAVVRFLRSLDAVTPTP